MAKKSKAKKSTPAAKKPAPAKRAAAKTKAPPKRPAKKIAGGTGGKAVADGAMAHGVHDLSTGSGAGPREIGADLVALFNAGKGETVEKKWWSPDIVSIEGMGTAFSGLKAVQAKNSEWMAAHEVLGGAAEGPYVGATGFAVKFRIHVRERASGKDIQMDEVGVYTVKNGKITREEFMYGG